MPGQTLQFSATLNGASLSASKWLVNDVAGGTPVTGTISSGGLYTAPGTALSTTVAIRVADTSGAAQSSAAQVSLFNPNSPRPGTVSSTANPLVALYTLPAPEGASVQVNFGTTTNYGLTTWFQPAPNVGGDVGIFVAGMRAGTTYHMQAAMHLPDGTLVRDADRTLTTGPIAADALPNITVQQTLGLTPAAGVEMLDLFQFETTNQLTSVVTDLDGNVIWYYPTQPFPPFPIKPLPNGHILIVVNNEVREVDLAGNLIYGLPMAQVQSRLNALGLSLPTLSSFHHDVLKLANGHFLVLANATRTDLPGLDSVTGDILIDWDPQNGPIWTWNSFDHIPLTHAPQGTFDWTHGNALVYSPDDGNLLFSMRNQNWIIKINYADGGGDGSILWRLGADGDFSLPPGVSSIEWNSGQHYPVLLGPSTSGIYPLLFFNNGLMRSDNAANPPCGTPPGIACFSSVPTFQLNEFDKTVQILSELNLSPAYSICCGSVGPLANGDLEFDIAADQATPFVSTIHEVASEQNPQLVWQMTITNQLAYRGFRIPSLYPGVIWSKAAMDAANASH